MLTGLHVVFLGGDARQLEVIRKCCDEGASVTIAGFDQLQEPLEGVKKGVLSAQLLSAADVLVLPVVGCDENGVISSLFSKDQMRLDKPLISCLPDHCTVYTGMARPYLRTLCEEEQVKLVELLDRDDVAIYNSIPTAEGALMMAIQNTSITIHGSQAMVLGMGRTGFTMARTLHALGAKVKVGVRAAKDFARAEEMGWEPFLTRDLGDNTGNIDLIFNTIPTMIITAQILANMPQSTVIIDLASSPGGCDFQAAKELGIKAMLAPGLPGIVAPRTAGVIIANALVQLISEEISIRGDGE